MDELFVIVLRIVHIFAGSFWFGAALFFFLFVEPTANELGPRAQPFVEGMVAKRKLPLVITTASAVAVVAGLLLYWRVSGGLQPGWIFRPSGLAFTIGGLTAIIAFAMGLVGIKPRVDRMGALGAQLAAAGRPPTPEEGAEMQRLQHQLRQIGLFDVILLSITVVAMAAGRYLG